MGCMDRQKIQVTFPSGFFRPIQEIRQATNMETPDEIADYIFGIVTMIDNLCERVFKSTIVRVRREKDRMHRRSGVLGLSASEFELTPEGVKLKLKKETFIKRSEDIKDQFKSAVSELQFNRWQTAICAIYDAQIPT